MATCFAPLSISGYFVFIIILVLSNSFKNSSKSLRVKFLTIIIIIIVIVVYSWISAEDAWALLIHQFQFIWENSQIHHSYQNQQQIFSSFRLPVISVFLIDCFSSFCQICKYTMPILLISSYRTYIWILISFYFFKPKKENILWEWEWDIVFCVT